MTVYQAVQDDKFSPVWQVVAWSDAVQVAEQVTQRRGRVVLTISDRADAEALAAELNAEVRLAREIAEWEKADRMLNGCEFDCGDE